MTNKKLYVYFLFFVIIDFLFYQYNDSKNNIFLDFFVVFLSLLKFFTIVFFLRKTKLFIKFTTFLSKFKLFSLEVSSKVISVYRILFGIILLTQALQSFDYISLVNYKLDNENLLLLKEAWYIWIFSIVIMSLGFGGRIFYYISYFGVSYYFQGTVGTELMRIGSFWLIFMGDNSYSKLSLHSYFPSISKVILKPSPKAWPVYFLSINLILNISTAGISKALDPFWITGYGFYYTLMQPWIKNEIFNFFLDYEYFMIAMSYLTIISEILVFLYIFKKTRLIGFLLILSMFSLLTFIFRIDPIGPVGLCICICLISLFKIKNPIQSNIVNYNKTKINWNHLIAFFSMIGIFKIYFFTLIGSYNDLKYPKIVYPFKLIQNEVNDFEYNKIETSQLRQIRKSYLWSFNAIDKFYPVLGGFYAPFNFRDFLSRFYYSIDCYNDKGIKNKSKIRIFNNDGTMHYNYIQGGILKPRVLQNFIYRLQLIHRDILLGRQIKMDDKSFLVKFFNYIKNYTGGGLKYSIINIKLIELPYQYEGDIKLWKKRPWTSFLKYDYQTNQFTVLDKDSYIDYFKNINQFKALVDQEINITYE